MHATSLDWTLRALQESPRLHIYGNLDGSYVVRSADDLDLYVLTDARFLAPTDPAYSSQKDYWRCFLSRHRGESVTEFRRHIDPGSAVGMTIVHPAGLERIKTGLEIISISYGVLKYRLKWIENQSFFFESTRQAPNTSPQEQGSLLCLDSRGTRLAWLIRSEHDMALSITPELSSPLIATLWFETGGIHTDVFEMILSSLLSITDIQYPISVKQGGGT